MGITKHAGAAKRRTQCPLSDDWGPQLMEPKEYTVRVIYEAN